MKRKIFYKEDLKKALLTTAMLVMVVVGVFLVMQDVLYRKKVKETKTREKTTITREEDTTSWDNYSTTQEFAKKLQSYAEKPEIMSLNEDVYYIHFIETYENGNETLSEIEKLIDAYNKNASTEMRVQINVKELEEDCIQVEVMSNSLKNLDMPVTELGQEAVILQDTVLWKDLTKEWSTRLAQEKSKEDISTRIVLVQGVAYFSNGYVSDIHMLDEYGAETIDKEKQYMLFIKYGETQGWVFPERLTRNGLEKTEI